VPVHRIRLVGPWQYRWQAAVIDGTDDETRSQIGDSDEEPGKPSAANFPEVVEGTVKMPCDWQSVFGLAGGCAAFSRRFHRPSNLESHERVFIVLTGVAGEGTISLNGERLAPIPANVSAVETDVTNHLQAFNLLELFLCFSPSADLPTRGGLYEAVTLEIRS
jgi:hypothetical protein